jgi:hypothetical protein
VADVYVQRPILRLRHDPNSAEIGGKGVHQLPGQDTVGLAQPFPLLTDGLVRLFLSCAEDPVDPGFEVGRSAF